MNDYIINPMWFYWADILSKLGVAFMCISVIGFILSAVVFIGIVTDGFDDAESRAIKKKMLKFMIIFSAVFIVSLLIPSKEVMYEVMIAKYLTHENLNLTVEAVRKAIEYIQSFSKAM